MLNSVIMMGRLTAAPEQRETQSGVSCTRFTIAVERSFAKQGEERKADFFDVIAWRGTGDFAARYFNKGQLVCVQGSMETHTYEDKNGVKRKAYQINAGHLYFAESKRDGQAAPSAEQIPSAADDSGYTNDDDLPF